MSNRSKIGSVIHSVRRKCREQGIVYLFYIKDQFFYVSEYPPTSNNKYILPTGYVKKFEGGKKLIPVGGTLKCFKDVFEKYPENFIGAYSTDLDYTDLKNDIEDFLK